MTNAERALEFVGQDHVIGLGSGRAAAAFIRALGERVRQGLRVRGVPTSEASAALARDAGVDCTTLDESFPLDLTVDGADEVDPDLNLIKGLGGALVREKIVAMSSRQLIILVGSEKLVPKLGSRGLLPIEVVPFGLDYCRRAFTNAGYSPILRMRDGRPFVSDNGNLILDCRVSPLEDPAKVEHFIQELVGVVGTGLFLGIADIVLVQDGEQVIEQQRPAWRKPRFGGATA